MLVNVRLDEKRALLPIAQSWISQISSHVRFRLALGPLPCSAARFSTSNRGTGFRGASKGERENLSYWEGGTA